MAGRDPSGAHRFDDACGAPARMVPSSLVAVWMTVAPRPVMPPHSVVLPAIVLIGPVPNHEVTSIGVVFAVVPVVVVTVVPIVDSDLHVRFLRLGAGHDQNWRGKGSSQEE
jgi:hypothetical protein